MIKINIHNHSIHLILFYLLMSALNISARKKHLKTIILLLFIVLADNEKGIKHNACSWYLCGYQEKSTVDTF